MSFPHHNLSLGASRTMETRTISYNLWGESTSLKLLKCYLHSEWTSSKTELIPEAKQSSNASWEHVKQGRCGGNLDLSQCLKKCSSSLWLTARLHTHRSFYQDQSHISSHSKIKERLFKDDWNGGKAQSEGLKHIKWD